ncbi:unnamed protein product [Meganyctiphanes norvegica]|uniref:Uncharacterized protein n=1 Tax=Meganyctiphanes norvegica TaxID=48144 RepID=A0AAV2Q994_MEGNR
MHFSFFIIGQQIRKCEGKIPKFKTQNFSIWGFYCRMSRGLGEGWGRGVGGGEGWGGVTVPYQTPSTLWVVVPQSLKHLLPLRVTVVVSLHIHVKHLLPLWVTGVVSNSRTQKYLPTWWLSLVVCGQESRKQLPTWWLSVVMGGQENRKRESKTVTGSSYPRQLPPPSLVHIIF